MDNRKKHNKKVNVLLVEIVNRNLGDCVIAETARYMIEQAIPKRAKRGYSIWEYNIYSRDLELVKRADLIVFAGGGLVKFKQENFFEYVSDILEIADEQEIPVFFNGVGVESYDEEDERCQRLKTALNRSCVKGITVRDDIETLQTQYIENTELRVKRAIDSVVFCEKVYGVYRKRESRTIGLGVIRSEIFEDYGIEGIDKQHQLEFWRSLTEEIEAMGYEWQLFTNGLGKDQTFALEVLAYCGKEAEKDRYLAKQVTNSGQLMELIRGYCGIVAGRMHSNIIAYGLRIPSVAIVWNDKILHFGERIGYEERMILAEQLDAKYVAEVLRASIKKGVKKTFRVRGYERTLNGELKRFMRKNVGFCFARKLQKEKAAPWQRRLVATALGGVEKRYSNINYVPNMEKKYNAGFRIFESDIRLTSDGKLVCINGWSDKTLQQLDAKKDQWQAGRPNAKEFSELLYYGEFKTYTVEELLRAFEMLEKAELILDIGKPSKEELDQMVKELDDLFREKEALRKRVTIRLQRKYDVKIVAAAECKYKMAYYLPKKESDEERSLAIEDVASFCKKNKLHMVTMAREAFSKEVAEQLHAKGLKICVFSYKNYTEIQQAIADGADMVGTHHIDVKLLKAMVSEI